MNTKLTLRMDESLIRRAKQYSDETGKSVSRLVADYFALLEPGEAIGSVTVTPRVRAWRGALAGHGLDERDYLRYLEEKHR